MDISKYDLAKDAENGFEFEILHPDTKEGLDGYITVRGERSKVVVNYTRKVINQQLRAEANKNNRNAKDKLKLVEDYLEDTNEAAVMRVISWRNIKDNGVEIPFSIEAAKKLFEELDWIREQVMEASNNSDNFPPSAT